MGPAAFEQRNLSDDGTRSERRHDVPLEVDHARASLHHQSHEGGLLPLPNDLATGGDPRRVGSNRPLHSLTQLVHFVVTFCS